MVKERKGPEGVLRFMLSDADLRGVVQRCIADAAYNDVLKRLAKEDSSVGARADAAMSFLATRKKLIAYTEGGGDVTEEFIAELAVETALGDMLRSELRNRTHSDDEYVRMQARQLMDALSVPARAEDMRRRFAGADMTAAIAYCGGKLATRSVCDLAALNRVAKEGGREGCGAQAALLYVSMKEFLADRLRVVSGSIAATFDLLNYIGYIAWRPAPDAMWLALQAVLEVMADRNESPEERLAAHLLGIVRDPLRRKFFDLLATSSSEDVADWLEGLAAVEFDRLAAEYQSGERRCESELMRTALGVFATMRHRVEEHEAASEPQTTETEE